jgi:hypothetical protein
MKRLLKIRFTGGARPGSFFTIVFTKRRAAIFAVGSHRTCGPYLRRSTGTRDLLKRAAYSFPETRYQGEHPMPAPYSFCLIRRLGLPHALAGLILMIAAPAAAQFMIGSGGLGIGIGIPPPAQQSAPPAQQSNPPPPSRHVAERRSNKPRNARREAPAPAKSDSNSSGAF